MASTRGGRAGPRPRALGAAALLAALGGLWAGFQWAQLGVARRGGDPFCALGAGDACAQLGDSAFARAIEGVTGMPVAGWGAVWSLAALVLPLLLLQRLGRDRSPEPLWSATLLAAVAGVGTVALLAGVSFRLGQLCSNCAITYVGVLAYAGLVLWQARAAPPRRLAAALPVCGGVAVAAFVVLLPFALGTPGAVDDASEKLLADAPASAPLGGGSAEDALARRIGSLSREQRQALSDARRMYLAPGDSIALRPARALEGSPMAPVRITTFSDLMCSHCSHLHEELERLRGAAPPDAFSIESRKFPLHASCNPYLPPGGPGALRCLAARVMICLEEHPQAYALEGRILQRHADLTDDLLFELAESYMSRAALEHCAASAQTQAKLDDDIAWAMAHHIEGTPLVLVNGRKTLPYLPFLYAMAMTGGDANHAIFEGLPAPTPRP
jgi:serine/threonine-protein kinase